MGYFSTWTERADAGVRFIAPYGLMVVLFIFNLISFSFPFTGAIKAPLFLMSIYYWSIYRPTLVPTWFVFIAGIAMDLISGLPVGLNALIFVMVRWSITDQRRFLMGQSFLMIWIGFMIVSVVAIFMQWAIFGFLSFQWVDVKPICFSIFLGISVFPLASIFFHMAHKILPEPHTRFLLKGKGK